MICNPMLSFLREIFCNKSLRGVKGGRGGGGDRSWCNAGQHDEKLSTELTVRARQACCLLGCF